MRASACIVARPPAACVEIIGWQVPRVTDGPCLATYRFCNSGRDFDGLILGSIATAHWWNWFDRLLALKPGGGLNALRPSGNSSAHARRARRWNSLFPGVVSHTCGGSRGMDLRAGYGKSVLLRYALRGVGVGPCGNAKSPPPATKRSKPTSVAVAASPPQRAQC